MTVIAEIAAEMETHRAAMAEVQEYLTTHVHPPPAKTAAKAARVAPEIPPVDTTTIQQHLLKDEAIAGLTEKQAEAVAASFQKYAIQWQQKQAEAAIAETSDDELLVAGPK